MKIIVSCNYKTINFYSVKINDTVHLLIISKTYMSFLSSPTLTYKTIWVELVHSERCDATYIM